MTLFRRGNTWWYEFRIRGQRVRESSHSRSKMLAREAERERRRHIVEGLSYIAARQPGLFQIHAKEWQLEMQPHWCDSTRRLVKHNLKRLNASLGKMLLTDIAAADIRKYQARRSAGGMSGATINLEVGTLRAILRRHRLWANLQRDVRMMRQRTDIGRALSTEESARLLAACRQSRSRSLYVAVLLSIHTGLRNAELRALRWRNIDWRRKVLRVEKSKTAGGEGREVPLTELALATLRAWREEFVHAPDHYIFPVQKVGFPSKKGLSKAIDPLKPIASWGRAWTRARKDAKVECRWHDLRHTFASRLAEGQVSDATMLALMGHMSVKMKERYSHTRLAAKRKAVEVLR
jgi:integrase